MDVYPSIRSRCCACMPVCPRRSHHLDRITSVFVILMEFAHLIKFLLGNDGF